MPKFVMERDISGAGTMSPAARVSTIIDPATSE